jgi:hypothetical protein
MVIQLKKFGSTLVSRQAGKEAYAAFQPALGKLPENETVEIDFEGVAVLTPSWGDEFISPLEKRLENNLVLKNTENPSVQATLSLLEEINGKKFRKWTQS